MVTGINSTTSSSAATTAKSTTKFASDFDDFLQLLTAQLKNQDPTAPLDTNAFTQQIVQFSAIEQSINQNKKLDELISVSKVGQSSALIGFSGKQVEAVGNTVYHDGSGKVDFNYEVESGKGYKDITVIVKDSSGKIVHSEELPAKDGIQTFNWEAINENSIDKAKLDKGNYTVAVSAKTEFSITGDPQTVYIKGIVSGMNLQTGSPSVIVNGENILLENIKFLGEPVKPTVPTTA
jgi:flagellar basal-body rod modification protein FlgD